MLHNAIAVWSNRLLNILIMIILAEQLGFWLGSYDKPSNLPATGALAGISTSPSFDHLSPRCLLLHFLPSLSGLLIFNFTLKTGDIHTCPVIYLIIKIMCWNWWSIYLYLWTTTGKCSSQQTGNLVSSKSWNLQMDGYTNIKQNNRKLAIIGELPSETEQWKHLQL